MRTNWTVLVLLLAIICVACGPLAQVSGDEAGEPATEGSASNETPERPEPAVPLAEDIAFDYELPDGPWTESDACPSGLMPYDRAVLEPSEVSFVAYWEPGWSRHDDGCFVHYYSSGQWPQDLTDMHLTMEESAARPGVMRYRSPATWGGEYTLDCTARDYCVGHRRPLEGGHAPVFLRYDKRRHGRPPMVAVGGRWVDVRRPLWNGGDGQLPEEECAEKIESSEEAMRCADGVGAMVDAAEANFEAAYADELRMDFDSFREVVADALMRLPVHRAGKCAASNSCVDELRANG